MIIYGAASTTWSQSKAMEKGVARTNSWRQRRYERSRCTVFAAHSVTTLLVAIINSSSLKMKVGQGYYLHELQRNATPYKITSTGLLCRPKFQKFRLIQISQCWRLKLRALGAAEKRSVLHEQSAQTQVKATASSSNQQQSNNSNIPGKPEPTLLENYSASINYLLIETVQQIHCPIHFTQDKFSETLVVNP